MKLILDIKPIRTTSSTHDGVLEAIRTNHYFCIGSLGNYLQPYPNQNRDTVRVYNLEKRRKRVERYRTRGKKATQSRVIKPAHWVGYYYDIPAQVLKMAGVKVSQTPRFFRFDRIG